jgi:TrmH family RNA methyltransferase
MSARIVRIGRRNSTYQVLESLTSNRQKRQKTGSFMVEGVQPLTMALRHGWTFAAVIYQGGRPLSAWAADIVSRCSAPVRYELDAELLADLSRKDTASELLAVLDIRDDSLGRIPVRPDLLVAVIDRPANPGNLGTLIRSCDAFGVHGLIVSGHAVDVYDPAVITATRGSLFALPVVRVGSHRDVERWIGHVRQTLPTCAVAGADERATLDVFDHDFERPTVVLFGNEAQGLSRACRALCDALVRIPMAGSATSLNVSAAASVILYEATRQRRRRAR